MPLGKRRRHRAHVRERRQIGCCSRAGQRAVLGDGVGLKANAAPGCRSGGAVSYGSGAHHTDAALRPALQSARTPSCRDSARARPGRNLHLYATRSPVRRERRVVTQAQVVMISATRWVRCSTCSHRCYELRISSIDLTATGHPPARRRPMCSRGIRHVDQCPTSTCSSAPITRTSRRRDRGGLHTPRCCRCTSGRCQRLAQRHPRDRRCGGFGQRDYGPARRAGRILDHRRPGGAISLTARACGHRRNSAGSAERSRSSFPRPGHHSDNADVTDPGYQPTLGIDSAATAVLGVGGATIMKP